MNIYQIWVDLLPGVSDLEFTQAVQAYLGALVESGTLHSYRITRRKFGFGPSNLGDFNISLEFENLAQLDEAFNQVAPRVDPIEGLHRAVFSKVTNFQSGLYRDFPAPVRVPLEQQKLV